MPPRFSKQDSSCQILCWKRCQDGAIRISTYLARHWRCACVGFAVTKQTFKWQFMNTISIFPVSNLILFDGGVEEVRPGDRINAAVRMMRLQEMPLWPWGRRSGFHISFEETFLIQYYLSILTLNIKSFLKKFFFFFFFFCLYVF